MAGPQTKQRRATTATTARQLTGAANTIITEQRYAGCDFVDDNSPFVIMFYVPPNASSVKLKLAGTAFPGAFYTELAYHRHAGVTVSGHTHNLTGGAATAAATFTGTEATCSALTFTGTEATCSTPVVTWDNEAAIVDLYYFDGSAWQPDPTVLEPGVGAESWAWFNMKNQLDGNSSCTAPKVTATGTINTPKVTATGSVALTGATAAASGTSNSSYEGTTNTMTLNVTAKKALVDTAITLNIAAVTDSWGTTYNSASSGFSELANVNANTGTAEIEIFPYVTANGFMFIKVAEPTANKGGRIAWHVTII